MKYLPIEILAPAKNLEVGRVAIDAGADAVYIGGPAFGARKAAGNSLEDIAELCQYAHFFNAKVLVTLNTLLKDEQEMQEAIRLAYAYKNIGVDAIIIQDLRLAKILFDSGDFPRANQTPSASSSPLRERGPEGRERVCYLHASTQCDNRTLERVQELEAMGFRRVVLARELSYAEIAHIRANTICELEAFVHGALCVSYSGACYLSEVVCGRSANRGECAQMCRLAYDVLDENRQEILHQKHILSLKDLDRSQHLRELLETGVTTLKIEGRLKDADYVRNVVAYYRMLLDSIFAEPDSPYRQASNGHCYRTFTPNPEKTFHRGATEYFAYERPAHLVNMDTPKSTGEYLGKAPINTSLLHNGDGITFNGEGFYWPNNRVRIPAGTPVYRNYDAEFHKQLMAPNACTRLLPVDICFEDSLPQPLSREGKGSDIEASPQFSITISGGGTTMTLALCGREPMAIAVNKERAEAVVRQQLSKLGGTRLEAASVTIRWSQPYFLPASVLNDMRRQAVDAFLAERKNFYPHGYRRELAVATRGEETCARALQLAKQRVASRISDVQHAEMTCKYCILHELGCCKKKASSTPSLNRGGRAESVPTYLRGQNGLLLKIHTNCATCTMTLTKE